MKVSLHTIRQLIDFDLPATDEIVKRINARLGGVEEIIDFGAKYKDIKIVKVVECVRHANADKLSVCMIDAGTGDLIQVVCGANNVHAGMWAAWLPPASTVPATYGDVDPFILSTRELRGVLSNGMLASSRELAIGDDHDGIVDIIEADVPPGKELAPGASFADVFGLNDTVIDIENKMFTHRPDLFGQLGVAREIAGIFSEQFRSPDWYLEKPEFASGSDELPIDIFNDTLDRVPRFMAVAIKDVAVRPSPLWLRCALVSIGGKPINNIVDATNYVMLTTAQPTHAYDYDKIRGQRLGARMAIDGESVQLLNGKAYQLTADDIVIADGEGAVGLAGIMGGGNSEVTSATKNIILEVANFDMYTVRKSSMRHGIFTDALARFNKGQSPLQNDRIMAYLMALLSDVAGGSQSSEVYDISSELTEGAQVVASTSFINERLGLSLSTSEITGLLRNVECKVEDDLVIAPPFWRTDLESAEDIVEEVGRLYGYEHLPRELPLRNTKPVAVNAERAMAQDARLALARAGANEVLTYSFVHERVLKAAGQEPGDAFQLSNALSPDLQYYRLSISPSLLDKVHPNIKKGHDEFALFEFGKLHSNRLISDEDGLPLEPKQVALVYASKTPKEGAAFYRAKQLLEFMADQIGVDLSYELLGDASTSPIAAPFEAKRSAIITDKHTGAYVGIIGEYKKMVARNFKLPDYAAGFEISTDALLALTKQATLRYSPLSRYPSVERDISFRVTNNTLYGDTYDAIAAALSATNLDIKVTPLGTYQPEDGSTKHVTFRVLLTSHEKTLAGDEVTDVMKNVANQLKVTIGAEVI